jgi:hypothetical protein
VPCDDEDAGCPYDPSPGAEASLSPDTFRALWLWQRVQALGPLALELCAWELTPSEADMLTEQLYELARYSQERPPSHE